MAKNVTKKVTRRRDRKTLKKEWLTFILVLTIQ